MKKILALSACLVLLLFAAFAVVPQRQTAAHTMYYATDFYGASGFTDKVFSVSYVERAYKGKGLALATPSYVVSNVTCVPTAGANILGFYDRYCTELIPNFTPGVVYAEKYYLYNAYDSNVKEAALKLASDMGLKDPSKEGATVAGFLTGFEKYCVNRDYDISFDSSMQGGSFSFEKAKSQLEAGKPIILFCSEFNISTMGETEKSDRITMHTSKDPHAMVAFGYSEYTYKLSNGSTRVYRYLEVATGISILTEAMVYVDSDITIDDAYAVRVF